MAKVLCPVCESINYIPPDTEPCVIECGNCGDILGEVSAIVEQEDELLYIKKIVVIDLENLFEEDEMDDEIEEDWEDEDDDFEMVY